MSLEMDDEVRPAHGVVVSLMDRGDGRSLLILDDVRSRSTERTTAWECNALYAQKLYKNAELDAMALTDEQYRDIGVALIARLLALNGRVR